MNAGAPARVRALAGQQLRPQVEHNQMKPETALRKPTLHDPVKDKVKGFPGERIGHHFHTGRVIQASGGIIDAGTRRHVAWPDHGNFACCRAF